MPGLDCHHAAAMYFIAGVRGALARIQHDEQLFCVIADAMEQGGTHLARDDRAALETAARWMRHLGAARHSDITTTVRLHD